MGITTIEISVEDLKILILARVRGGSSYAEISDELGGDFPANTIKQFAHRVARTPRETSLTRAIRANYDKLASEVSLVGLAGSNAEPLGSARGCRERLRKNYEFALSGNMSEAPHIHGDIHAIFLRKIGNEFISSPVYIYRERNQIFFEMKIIGHRSRRIIIGKVFESLQITYMLGLSFGVNNLVETADFLQSEFLDEDEEDESRIADNTYGVELVSFPTRCLGDTVFPVQFTGVDGNGNPIIGRGAFVRDFHLENVVNEHFGVNHDLGFLPPDILKLVEANGLETIEWT